MIRVLLIEDLALVRESLAMALATAADLELRWCASIHEGIDLLNGSPAGFDVVLLKQGPGARQADELLPVANRSGVENRVLILTPGLGDLGGQTWFDIPPVNDDSPYATLSPQGSRDRELVLAGLASYEIGVRLWQLVRVLMEKLLGALPGPLTCGALRVPWAALVPTKRCSPIFELL